MNLYIEDARSDYKHVANDVRVYVVDNDGVETDISSIVRRVNVDLEVGSVARANLEVFITGFESRCIAESVVLNHLPKRGFWRRARDITGFNRDGMRWYA